MKCTACGFTLSEGEQKMNEWGFLETMCDQCLSIGRDANFDSEVYEIALHRNIEIDYDPDIPGWATCVKENGNYKIAFEKEPIFDEEAGEWISNGGQSKLIGV